MIKNSPYKDGSIERGGFSLRGSQANIIPTEPLNVPLGQRQLIMSNQVMESCYDCHRTVHPVEKHSANPLISGEKPWESEGLAAYGSVLYDPELDKFHLWGMIWPYEGTKEKGGLRGIYYQSSDGLHWQRPNLGQYEYQGNKDNNLLECDFSSFGDYLSLGPSAFFMPPEHTDKGRFGAVLAAVDLRVMRSPDSHGMNQFLAFSDDGKTWKLRQEHNPFFRGRNDTHQSLVWNPDRKVFMYYRRATINAKEIRRIAYTESADLINWTQPRVVVNADELDTLYLYGMTVTRYQNIYLGLLQNLYSHADHDRVKVPKSLEVDIQLTWSCDGFSWDRHPQRPIFIPTGPLRPGVPDWGGVYAFNDMIDVGDRVYVYYVGYEGLHTSLVQEKQRHLCMGTLRRDGFVSLDAPREGWALTAPLRCPGGKLHINANTAGDGVIQVAVREGEGVRDGEWPEPWSLDYATDFTGDQIDHEVNWKGQQDLSPWKGKTIRLEFRLVKASLYSFWFV